MPSITKIPQSPATGAAGETTLVPRLARELAAIVGEDGLIADPDELIVYECDGFTIPKAKPLAVVFPKTTEQVSRLVIAIRDAGLAIMPRGTGTGLTGGIVAVTPGVQISLARMNRILEIDLRNRWALVEAGVTNGALSQAIAASDYHYAPDPSSQKASSIGGNVATNAGGLHTLKYGVTVNHILGLEVVLDDGSIHILGGPQGYAGGPDLVGLLCGTEGTLAIVTRIWCRLVRKPVAFRTALAIFEDATDGIIESPTTAACRAVSDIIAAGIIPAALEMMDGAMIQIVEDAFALGLPRSAKALLVIEVDGQPLGLDDDMAHIETICRAHGCTRFQSSADADRRAQLWTARRRAFGAIGRVSPSYCTQDACVPRSKLPQVIERINAICAAHGLRATNVFHAGDGNVHPALMYDENDPASVQRALAASHDILTYCAAMGGAITGEHGVGIEKLPFLRLMFSETDIAGMHKIRQAIAPHDLLNPLKTLPREGITISLTHPARRAPQ